MGLIIGHYLHKCLHQIHQNWPFKSRNCTHFGDNLQKSRYKAKITVTMSPWRSIVIPI